MSELSYAHSILLGILQGVTEFLPISSSGHLALVQSWLGLKAESDAMIAFDLAVHLGTLVSVLLVFAGRFGQFLRRLIAETSRDFTFRRTGWRIVGLGVLASVPTACVGLTFKDQLEDAFGKPLWIGIALIVTGTLLWVTRYVQRARRGWRQFGWSRALLIGLAQAVAIMPGISRSGSTISVALIAGIKRRWAGEFSFFIAFPAICGATLLEFGGLAHKGTLSALRPTAGPLLIGAIVSAAVGYLALRVLLAAVDRAKLHWFSFYCWAAGALVLYLALR